MALRRISPDQFTNEQGQRSRPKVKVKGQ